MKKTLLLTSMLLALTVSVALAGGVNLNWGTVCYTETPLAAKTFACLTNTANPTNTWPMTASFVIDVPIPDFVGVEIMIESQSDAVALPDWWKVGGATDCRTGKISFTAAMSDVGYEGATCLDWYGASALSVFGYSWDTNRAHIGAAAAIPADAPMLLPAATEYYAGKFIVTNSKTVGTGSCAGCSTGMIFGLYSVAAAGVSGQRIDLGNVLPGGNQCLSWNNSVQPCAAPVPARNTTWGQVKSLYR